LFLYKKYRIKKIMVNQSKPYVLFIAEIIYKNVVQIKLQYPNINNEEAINKFLETDTYKNLSSGKLHNDWFNKLKINNFIDEETGNKIPEETIKLLNIQKKAMIKQLIKIPNLYDVKNNNLLELSTRAYKLIFRMCESYELWCKETNQSQLIQLDVLD